MSVRVDVGEHMERRTARVLDGLRAGSVALDVAIVSGVSFVLGLIRLGTPSLWYDEAYTYRQIQRGYIEQFEGYQPFYYWIEKPWTTVAGTSEWALRFPSVVGAMAACALVVILARRLFDDRAIALLSGLLLATSPFIVKWSQQGRAYSLLVAWSLVATLLLLRALERASRRAWAAYGLSYAILLVTHAAAGILLAPVHAMAIVQRRRSALPHGLLAGLIIAGVGLPWIAQLAMRTNNEASETAWIPFPSVEYVLGSFLGVSGAAGVGLVLAVFGFWALRRGGSGGLASWLAVWALAPFVIALVVSIVRPVFLDRYLAIAAPAFAMLAAVAVVTVSRRVRIGMVCVTAAATAAGLAVWYSSAGDGNWRGEDWRRATTTVTARADEADAVVVVPWWAHDAAEYYGAEVTDISSADSIWVLHWSEGGPDLPADVRTSLGFGRHELAQRLQFGRRVSAQLWKRPG
jgi:mannosyltransferase